MTDDPERNSGSLQPSLDESARPPVISAESGAPSPGVPDRDAAEVAKLQERRDFTAREMASIARKQAELQSELRQVAALQEGVHLLGPGREKWRTQRNGLRDRLEALDEALEDGQRRLKHLDQLLRLDSGEHALATRRGSQEAAALVAEEIRTLIVRMAELWQRFELLREEDRVQADVVRSVSPGRLGEINTFSWTTGVDQTFAAAIAGVISECHRVNRELVKRQTTR